MRFIVYRLMPARMKEPTRTWHEVAQCHLDQACARRHMRRSSRMIRQAFNYNEVPDVRWCKWCTGGRGRNGEAFRGGPYPDGSGGRRDTYLRTMLRRWHHAFTKDFTIVLLECERLSA